MNLINTQIRVVFYQRKPADGRHFSIEGFFRTVRASLVGQVDCVVAESRFSSRGILRRAYNLIEAPFRQGDVNHITGDIHYVSLLLRRRKTVLTIHDCGFESNLSPTRRALFRWFWLLLPLKRVGLVVADSKFTRQRIAALSSYPENKIEVIPVCISPIFRRIEKSFNAACPNILQVGTSPKKNLDRSLQALIDLPCKLYIVGKLSPLQKEMMDASKIQWTNRVGVSDEELLDLYSASDIVLFASTYEGFGMPIVEAQTVGRPVITSNVTSMPDVAGEGACLVDPYDVQSIRNAVHRIIDDENYRHSLVKSGYVNVERFQPHTVAQQYLNVYRRLCSLSSFESAH